MYVGNFGAAVSGASSGQFSGIVCCAPYPWKVQSPSTPYHIFDINAVCKYRPSDQLLELKSLMSFVQTRIACGNVLLHCKAGRHRAAATACCLILMNSKTISGLDAIRRVEQHRRRAEIYRASFEILYLL